MTRRTLFVASCFSILTTAIAFSVRSDVLEALGRDFHLTNSQLGILLSPAFWGFTFSIFIGGSLVDYIGMRRLLSLSSVGYIVAPLLIICAPRPAHAVTPYYTDVGFICLYIGMFLLGISQGLVEGVVNPLVTTLYANEKTRRLNILHAWWPGGLIIGGLLVYGMTKLMGLDQPGITSGRLTLGWQAKIILIAIPSLIYGLMILRADFPRTERVEAGVTSREMFSEILRPMFLLWLLCMWMTSSTELGPDQWTGPLITTLTGMQGILILVYTAGLMFLLRFFVGSRLTSRISPIALLALCSALSAAGLLALAQVKTPAQAFAAASIFGVGVAFFWPTMLGVTSERFPRGGPVALALVGGTGQLAVAFILPLMGKWYDAYGAASAFRFVSVLPMILVVLFGGLALSYKASGGYHAIKMEQLHSSEVK